MAKTKIEKPKGVKKGETVAEWYERTTKQRIGSLVNQGTSVINGV
jgi:hypothetical protein